MDSTWAFIRLGALVLFALLPLRLPAYTLAPSLLTLGTGGADASSFVRLVNRTAQPAAVEISIYEHGKDLDGNSVTGPLAEDQFLVFPAQVAMLPGDEVGVQVRWTGAASLAVERAYTLVAREVAIPRSTQAEALSGARIDIEVLKNYEARIYVRPPGARPTPVVRSVTKVPGSGRAADPEVEVVIANEGSAHQDLSSLTLLLVPRDGAGNLLRQNAVRVAVRDLPATRAHLLPGGSRRLRLARPAALAQGDFDVLLSN